jgi:dTDP-4-dehydrorhamnose 3,5-epimerase
MKKIETKIEGVYLIKLNRHTDNRGQFIKIFNSYLFKDLGIVTEVMESYISTSNKNVIRGMHFQLSPKGTDKLIYVIKGSIVDVVFDLRKNSSTYAMKFHMDMSEEEDLLLYLPAGVAHGFKSMEDNTVIISLQSQNYDTSFDSGIHYNSFGFDWDLESPILSERDINLAPFSEKIDYFI